LSKLMANIGHLALFTMNPNVFITYETIK
jgi:hypothetical protein